MQRYGNYTGLFEMKLKKQSDLFIKFQRGIERFD